MNKHETRTMRRIVQGRVTVTTSKHVTELGVVTTKRNATGASLRQIKRMAAQGYVAVQDDGMVVLTGMGQDTVSHLSNLIEEV